MHNRVGLRARIALALICGVTANATVIAPAAAAGDIATTIELQSITSGTADPNAPFVPLEFHLYADTAAVTEPAPAGTIRIMETTSGTPVEVMSQAYPGNYTSIFSMVYTPGFDIGTHTFKAVWEIDPDIWIDSESAPVDYTVAKETDAFILLSGENVLEAHHSLRLDAPIGASSSRFATNATVKIFASGNATALCTVAVSTDNTQGCTLTFNTPGTFELTAQYSGNTWVTGVTSEPWMVTVNPDLLHATGVGIDVATFYPYKDGYRDVVRIRGTRGETIAVTARIYNPSGSLIKTITLAKGIGAYATTWNGRNGAGTIYAEGKYKIVQTLKDNAGTTATVTNYVNLSKKRLVTKTSTITKLGSSVAAKGTAGTGTVSLSTSAGTAVLKAGSAGAAAVGWELTLPSAATYTSLKFKIYAKAGYTIPYQSEIAMQSFPICAYASGVAWDTSCFNHWATIGTFSGPTTAWWSTSGHPTNNRSGTKVRGMVNVPQGSVTVYKAAVTVTYGVLQY